MLSKLGCWLLHPLKRREQHRKSAEGFLQNLRLSTWGRENHRGLPRFWLRWFETENKCKTNINSLYGGCLLGLESRDSLQVWDTVALGIALSNPKGLGDEIWKRLGFFTEDLQLDFPGRECVGLGLYTSCFCRVSHATNFSPLSVPVGCSNLFLF